MLNVQNAAMAKMRQAFGYGKLLCHLGYALSEIRLYQE